MSTLASRAGALVLGSDSEQGAHTILGEGLLDGDLQTREAGGTQGIHGGTERGHGGRGVHREVQRLQELLCRDVDAAQAVEDNQAQHGGHRGVFRAQPRNSGHGDTFRVVRWSVRDLRQRDT